MVYPSGGRNHKIGIVRNCVFSCYVLVETFSFYRLCGNNVEL